MWIISKRKIREYGERHADALPALLEWHQLAEASEWKTIVDVRKTFPHADPVGNKTVFNIKGNSYRLITAIHYNTGKIFVREILTHAEYDRGDWKQR